MNKIYEKLLADYKKANKEYKKKLLAKFGFKTEQEFFDIINIPQEVVKEKLPKQKPVVHLVDVLDASGSMMGDKIINANEAIEQSLLEFKKETNVDYRYWQVSFSGSGDQRWGFQNKPIANVKHTYIRTRGATALYETIILTIDNLLNVKDKNDKVLLKIYTDGDENNSHIAFRSAKTVVSKIKEAEEQGFTVTFIGTVDDVNRTINRLNIDESNTQAYDGTAEGLRNAMSFATQSTVLYASKVARGENVTKGFYKQVGTL